MSVQDAESKAAEFEAVFPLLEDSPDIYPKWKFLVAAGRIISKQVHDARLVAVCQVHKVSHILTFNMTHFSTIAAFAPGIVIVDPATV